jgi:hypothetical protein
MHAEHGPTSRVEVCCGVSLLTERDRWVGAGSYKHLAPLERKRIQRLQL